jgi:hypothetical protein
MSRVEPDWRAIADADWGPAIDAGRARARFAGVARFRGSFACSAARREVVAALLPRGLRLADSPTRACETTHPVLVAFGEQRDGALLWTGAPFPVGDPYLEVAVLVPFVRHEGGRYLHTFVPAMLSTSAAAVWSGNEHYGFAKHLGAEQTFPEGADFAVAIDGEPAFTARFERSRESPAAAVRALAERVGRLPVVGRLAAGDLVTSYFEWDLHGTSATGHPCRIGSAPPLPREIATDAASAIDVHSMEWKLSWPMPFRG